MKSHYVSSWALVVVLLFASNCQLVGGIQSYGTNKQRTETVKKYCSKSRSQMIWEQENSKFEEYGGLTRGEVDLNGDLAIKYMLQGQEQNAYNQIRSNAKVWIYFIFFIIGLVCLVVFAPFLVCCCLCPDSCPPCTKCRKPSNEPYSNFQNCCPPLIVVILSIVIVGCMIASLIWGVKLQKSYDQIQCSVAFLFDDAINGNVTVDQNSYFIGLQPFKSAMISLNKSLSDIQQKLQPIASNGTKVNKLNTQINQTKTNVKNIPDGAGGNLTLKYDSPINAPIPTTKINSNFPQILGNADTPQTLVGNASLGLIGASIAVSLVSVAADHVLTVIPKFSTQLNSSIAEVNYYIKKVTEADSEVDAQLTDGKQNYVRRMAIAFYIIVSALIIFGCVMAISSACVCRFRYSCRKIMYLACVFLFVLGVLSFLLTLAFSTITLGSYLGCSYLRTGISSPSKFEQYFNPIFNDTKTTRILSKCVPTGSGQILQQIIGTNSYSLLKGIGNVTTQLDGYSSTKVLQAYDDSYRGLSKIIQNYGRARTLDIDPKSEDAKYLQTISNANNFACSTSGFDQDSWVPSVQQTPSYVTCKIPNGTKVTNSSCSNFTSRDAGCVGCFDTYALFQKNTTSAEVASFLLARYPSTDCSAFRDNLTSIWNNFYKIKKQTISPIYTRAVAAEAELSQIKTTLNTSIAPTFAEALSTLRSTHSSLTDQKYGLVAGLNCRVLGEDVNLIIRASCNNLFVHSYLLRIMFAVTSFCILFLMMFVVCTAVRSVRSQNKYARYSQEIQLQSDKGFSQNDKKSQGAKYSEGRSSGRRRRSRKTGSSQELKHIQF